VLSSGSCRSTNTAVLIWHTGFLISYLLAGQIAARFQGRITHYCLKEKELEEKKIFNILSYLPPCCYPKLPIGICYKLLMHY